MCRRVCSVDCCAACCAAFCANLFGSVEAGIRSRSRLSASSVLGAGGAKAYQAGERQPSLKQMCDRVGYPAPTIRMALRSASGIGSQTPHAKRRGYRWMLMPMAAPSG